MGRRGFKEILFVDAIENAHSANVTRHVAQSPVDGHWLVLLQIAEDGEHQGLQIAVEDSTEIGNALLKEIAIAEEDSLDVINQEVESPLLGVSDETELAALARRLGIRADDGDGGMPSALRHFPKDCVSAYFTDEILRKSMIAEANTLHRKELADELVVTFPMRLALQRQIGMPVAGMMLERKRMKRRHADAVLHAAIAEETEKLECGSRAVIFLQMRSSAIERLHVAVWLVNLALLQKLKEARFGDKEGLQADGMIDAAESFRTDLDPGHASLAAFDAVLVQL